MKRPKVTKRDGAANETVIEYRGRSSGGLISVRENHDGSITIEPYRHDGAVLIAIDGAIVRSMRDDTRQVTRLARVRTGLPIRSEECAHFVSNADGSYTCEACLTRAEWKSMADPGVEVWEVGSRGWTEPVACNRCKRPIDVIRDGARDHGDEFEGIGVFVSPSADEPMKEDGHFCASAECLHVDHADGSQTVYMRHPGYDMGDRLAWSYVVGSTTTIVWTLVAHPNA